LLRTAWRGGDQSQSWNALIVNSPGFFLIIFVQVSKSPL
jgi:hypothetical protein